ncbi:MAG: hypothetical protein K9M17_02770 [Mariprofundaceae bacterium]|nr:hypothetical protein [Mariprofundaceae bacterium]
MSDDLQIKKDLIAELTKAMEEAAVMSILLENNDNNIDAQNFWKKKVKIKKKIDELVDELFDDWAVDTIAVVSDLKAANNELEEEVKRAKNDYNNLQAIANGLKVLDKIINFSTKFI